MGLYSSLSWTLVVSFFATVLFDQNITTSPLVSSLLASQLSPYTAMGGGFENPEKGLKYSTHGHQGLGLSWPSTRFSGARVRIVGRPGYTPGQHTASKPGLVGFVGNAAHVRVGGPRPVRRKSFRATTTRASSTTFETHAVDNQIYTVHDFLICYGLGQHTRTPPPPNI